MKALEFEIDGQRVRGLAQKVGGTLWVHINGRTFSYEPPKPVGRRGARGPGPVHGDVVAPMPGKINKVAVAQGDKVEAGQLVLVMEAMKMEYTLKASTAGTIAGVHCAAGDQVTLGQTLVKIEPA